MDATDIARKHGATTIVITTSGFTLAASGHIHLSADHPEGYDRYSPVTSRLMHLMVIDVLATQVALRIGGFRCSHAERNENNLQQTLCLDQRPPPNKEL